MKFQEIEMNEFLNGITLGKVMKGIVRMFLRLFDKSCDFFFFFYV